MTLFANQDFENIINSLTLINKLLHTMEESKRP